MGAHSNESPSSHCIAVKGMPLLKIWMAKDKMKLK